MLLSTTAFGTYKRHWGAIPNQRMHRANQECKALETGTVRADALKGGIPNQRAHMANDGGGDITAKNFRLCTVVQVLTALCALLSADGGGTYFGRWESDTCPSAYNCCFCPQGVRITECYASAVRSNPRHGAVWGIAGDLARWFRVVCGLLCANIPLRCAARGPGSRCLSFCLGC